MFINEVEVQQANGSCTLHLRFQKKLPVYCVESNPRCPDKVWQAFSTAVETICGRRYAKRTVSFGIFGRGSIVRMVFLVSQQSKNTEEINSTEIHDGSSTSRQAIRIEERQQHTASGLRNFDLVSVSRRLSSLNVEYSVNGGSLTRCSLNAFQLQFFTNVDYILPQLKQLQPGLTSERNRDIGNWARLLDTQLSKRFHDQYACIEELLERFVRLSQRDDKLPAEHIVTKLTTSCLLAASSLIIARKTNICRILKDVRRIFEFISALEYTVWFFIPMAGSEADLTTMDCEVLDIENISTHIQLRSEQPKRRAYRWTNAEHELQDLLVVAFQLAFAAHCKQRIIFLRNLKRLGKYQSFHMALATALSSPTTSTGGKASLSRKNYIQRIIDACIQIGVTAIMEYPGALPVPVVRANHIKCHRNLYSASGNRWSMHVSGQETAMSSERVPETTDS